MAGWRTPTAKPEGGEGENPSVFGRLAPHHQVFDKKGEHVLWPLYRRRRHTERDTRRASVWVGGLNGGWGGWGIMGSISFGKSYSRDTFV